MTELTTEDFEQIFLVLFQNKLLIALFTAAGLFAGLLYTAGQPEVYLYDASATVSVAFGSNLGPLSGSTVISNYADIVNSNRVSEYAATLLEGEGLTAQQIQRMVSISADNNSYLLRINARNHSPRIAILVANAVAESFVTQVSVITGSNSIQVLDHAASASSISFGGSSNVLVLAPAGALFIACMLVALLELRSGMLRSVKQCIVDDGELLAVIPKAKIK